LTIPLPVNSKLVPMPDLCFPILDNYYIISTLVGEVLCVSGYIGSLLELCDLGSEIQVGVDRGIGCGTFLVGIQFRRSGANGSGYPRYR